VYAARIVPSEKIRVPHIPAVGDVGGAQSAPLFR
jgi:hypothetical protein